MDFLKEQLEDESSHETISEDIVRNYLLDSDFRSIPEGCVTGVKVPIARGDAIITQLVKAVDISRPVGPEDEEEGEEDPSEEADVPKEKRQFRGNKRLMRLTLVSVGSVVKFEVLEVGRIACLSDDLVPGCKFLLTGPLSSAGGFFLLKSNDCIKIVGGRVNRLAEGWKLNRDVKARRGGDRATEGLSGGPPKFVSFMDYQAKQSKRVAVAPVVVKVEPKKTTEPTPSRTVDGVDVSDKMKELQSAKLAGDAFAMRQKGGKGERKSRGSRRDNDELEMQYQAPSRTAPQLSAFVRLDKCATLQDAQLLSDAMAEKTARQPQGDARQGSGLQPQNDARHGSYGKGRDRDTGGKGFRGSVDAHLHTAGGKAEDAGAGYGKGSKGGKGRGDRYSHSDGPRPVSSGDVRNQPSASTKGGKGYRGHGHSYPDSGPSHSFGRGNGTDRRDQAPPAAPQVAPGVQRIQPGSQGSYPTEPLRPRSDDVPQSRGEGHPGAYAGGNPGGKGKGQSGGKGKGQSGGKGKGQR